MILIIGAGALGSALNKVFVEKRLPVTPWDKDPVKSPASEPLEKLAARADFILLCVPSFAIRSAASELAPLIKKDAIVVSFAKGIEEGTKKLVDEVLGETLPPGTRLAVVGGPMLADEIMADLTSMGVVASKDQTAVAAIADIFSKTNVRIEPSHDVRGVAIAGILKNIYSIALGIADGLGTSANEKGWLTTRAGAEMADIGVLLGGERETFWGTAGLADLIATGYSPYSRNRQTGIAIVGGFVPEIKGEGLISLPSLLALLGDKQKQFPVLRAITRVILERTPARKAVDDIFKNV